MSRNPLAEGVALLLLAVAAAAYAGTVIYDSIVNRLGGQP